MPTAAPDLGRALDLAARGEDRAARALLEALLETDGRLADHYLHQLAALAARDGRAAEAAAADTRLLAEFPSSVWVPAALARAAARAEKGAGDPDALAARALAHPDVDAGSRALALLVQGDRRAATAPREAYRLHHDVRRIGGPAAGAAIARGRALERAHPALLTDVDLQLEEAALCHAEGRAEEAAARLKALAARIAPARRGEVLRALAHTLRLSERFDEAVTVLRRAVALDPATDNPARLQLAYRLWSLDRDDAARTMFAALLAEGHPARASIVYALGRMAEDRGDLDAALARYREVARSGDATLARDAAWRLAWAPYRVGELERAAAAFAELARASAEDREAALYWRGRIHERTGERAAASASFQRVLDEAPEGFYAGLAEERLGWTLPPPARPEPRADAPPPELVAADEFHWSRRQALLDAEVPTLAARETAAWIRGLPPAAAEPFLLPVLATTHLHARARALAYRLRRDGGLGAAAHLAYDYPLAYWGDVQRLAAAEGVDPYLVLAVMRQESLFDPEALSPVGARGLMQLMPHTAARLAGGPVDLRALADPVANVGLGVRYLRRLLDRYDGRVPWAVAGYNAGEPAVDKWQARDPDAAPDVFVESISYRETRTYVKRVLANLRRYQRLYGPRPPG